jgi:hypothetical protein
MFEPACVKQNLRSDMKQMRLKVLSICTVSVISFFATWSILIMPGSVLADDGFIKGYASAVLEREFNVTPDSLDVRDGVVYLKVDQVEAAKHAEIVNELLRIKGVQRVETAGAGQAEEAAARGTKPEQKSETMTGDMRTDYMQKSDLFAPLMADPLWPHFEFAYQYYVNDNELKNVFAPTFGEVMPLYRDGTPFSGYWEIAVWGTASIIHDLDEPSWDLVNTDYRFGLALSFRKDALSGVSRVFHHSSHIGDEFLLKNNVSRVNFSFEAVDTIFSYDLRDWLRVYGGGGYMFSPDPDTLDPFFAQYGVELYCPTTYANGTVRPVAGIDIQNWEMHAWGGQISLRAGVQIESPHTLLNRINLLAGYYNGKSHHGSFYEQSDEYYHLGAQYEF